MSFEETELSWYQFLSSESFLRIPFRRLILHTPPPLSLAFSGCIVFLLAILPRRELEEAFFVIGTKTDVINKDLEEVICFL